MSRQPRHRKEPRHRLDGPADTGHAATALVLPVLLGGVLLLVAVSSGHWSYLMRHLPKWPITATPNGFTFLILGLICGVGYAGWRLLARVEASVYDDLHDYIDGDYDLDPPEAYELEQAARRPFLENLAVATAHYFGRRLADLTEPSWAPRHEPDVATAHYFGRRAQPDLDGPEPEDPWFGCRADKVQAGFIRDLWLTEPERAPRYEPDEEPEW